MTKHPLGDPVRLEDLLELQLDAGLRERALALVAQGPDGPAWRRLLDRASLFAGTALMLSGIVCFFAFNWQGLHRFGKFGLIALGLAGAAGLAWKAGLQRLAGQVALLAACVLVGVWLAVFGQVYQTGADAFELFRGWALLILPWVLLARFQGLWAFWILLLNLWLGLWWDQTGSRDWQIMTLSFAALNGTAWLLREALQDRLDWIRGRWLARILLLATLGYPLACALLWLVGEGHGSQPLALWLSMALAGALVALFRRRRRDLFMVTAGLATGIALLTTRLGYQMVEHRHLDGCGVFLLLGLLLVAQVGAAAAWLRRLYREAP